ncbi:hypothetical protein [Brevundimonas sp.]|nr:hypothetical protein [Brevundimonas sp.]
MLTPDELDELREVLRQELARALHPSVLRPATPLPANDRAPLTPEPPEAA